MLRIVNSVPQIAISVTALFITGIVAIRVYTEATTRHCTSKARMEGKTVIVTGANSGMEDRVRKNLEYA